MSGLLTISGCFNKVSNSWSFFSAKLADGEMMRVDGKIVFMISDW